MANSACSVKIPVISSAFLSKEGNEILSSIKASRYVDYINILFGNVFKREYLDNDSFVTLSDFTDDNNKLTVNGSLNNLYSKVKEELDRQINSSFMLTLPDKDTVAKEIGDILNNWNLFVSFHSKYNSYINVRPEDLEESEKETNNFDKKGNEHNEFQLLTNEVRTLFKFFPKTILGKDTSGKLVGIPATNPVDGLPIRGDFENIFKLTLDILKGVKNEDEFIEKLTSIETLYRIPELYFLFEILPVNNTDKTNNLNDKQRLLFHQLFQTMSRDYIPVYASSMTYEENTRPTFLRFKSAKSNLRKINSQFISNFISNTDENEYVKADNTLDEKNPENSSFGRKRLYSLPKKLQRIDLPSDQIEKLTVRKIKTDYKDYFDFFKLIGVEFSDFTHISNKKVLIDILNHALDIHDNLSVRLSVGEKIFNPLVDMRKGGKYPDPNNVGRVLTVYSLRKVVENVLKFEGTISKVSATHVTKGANGENQSDITYSNAISIGVSQLNEAKSLDDLYTKSYFLKLRYNPLHKNSYVSKNVVGNKNISYELENYSGHVDNLLDGTVNKSDTKSLKDTDKYISDFNNLMGWGTINTPQLESKSGYFAIKFVDNNTGKNILPFKESLFTNDFITESDFKVQIINYLQGEIERIKSYKLVSEYAPKAYSEFYIFKDFVSEEAFQMLMEPTDSNNYKKAEAGVLQKVNQYFNTELELHKNFIDSNSIDLNSIISKKVLLESQINEKLFESNKDHYIDSLLRTFIANTFVHNVEFGIYISGDPLYYKDYHKRLGGLSSTGTQAIGTNNLKSYFNSDKEKIFWNEFSLRGILNQFLSDEDKVERRDNFNTFLSAVLKDDIVRENTEYQKEETISNYIYSVKLNTGKDITREEAFSDLKISGIEKDGITVGDGQGYLNLDASRELSIKQGTYKPQQNVSYKYEALIFKQMLLEEQGKDLDSSDLKLLKKLENQILKNPEKYAIPTLKQTYYGTLSNEEIKIDGKVFDKFSLATLFPSTARKHPELRKLLLAMAKRQIHYIKYESGTKGYKREIFNSVDEIGNEDNRLDELQSNLLKLQIPPSKKEKTSTKLLTQQVKLFFTNLFDQGKATDNVVKLRDKFINDLNNIKSSNRKSILKKLGFKTNEDGLITSWDKAKIIDALVSQVNLQKLPTPILEALETDDNGNFENSIESSNIYQQLLNYVTGKLDSNLREFKVGGGDFVLISESMFNTPLKYFRLNQDKTKILPCDCRITLNKEYAKMLNLQDIENPGKIIGTIDRLNELLKVEEFRNKYEKELTVVFARPPVQGPNSMGVATIVEFFSPTHGNVLQLPKEFMHQSGIDFDYDKEKVFVPNLTDGGLFANDENLKKELLRLKESQEYKELSGEAKDLQDLYDYIDNNLEEFEDEDGFEEAKKNLLDSDKTLDFILKIFNTKIEDISLDLNKIKEKISNYLVYKDKVSKLNQNKLAETSINILQQPEIYSELILPNTDETVKPLAIKNGQETGTLNTLPKGIDRYSYLQNLKVFKLFNDAKNLLAYFAIDNVFTELIAPLDISIRLDYLRNDKGIPTRRVNRLLLNNKDRIVNLSSRYDINGNNRQHILSEIINATVDSGKDPYFANFSLSRRSINTFTFLLTLGYPVETAVDFTSSAIVREFLKLQDKNPNLPKESIVKILFKSLGLLQEKENFSLGGILSEDASSINLDNSELVSKIKDLKPNSSLRDKSNYKYHRAILFNYIAMGEHAKELGAFKSIFKNDTKKTSSLFEIASKNLVRKSIVSNGMFSLNDIEKVEKQSTLTAFMNDDLIGEVLKNVFPIMHNSDVSRELGNLYNESKKSLSEIDKRVLSQIMINDYITTILYSFTEYKGQNFFLYGKNLLTKGKNPDGTINTTLLERIYKFKKNKEYSNLIRVFPVLEKILGEVTEKPVRGNSIYMGKHGFNIFLNIDPNIPVIEKENYMDQLKQIYNGNFTTENPLVKDALIDFVKDFFIVGLMQSGFNKGGTSYTEYIPVKFIQSLLNPSLSEYNLQMSYPDFSKKYLAYFKRIFTFNNARYFFINRDNRGSIVKSTYLGKSLYVPGLVRSLIKNDETKNSIVPQTLEKLTESVENTVPIQDNSNLTKTRFETIDQEIGTIITIGEGRFRLLDVYRDPIYVDSKVLELQSKSGLLIYGSMNEDGSLSLDNEKNNQGLNDIGFNKICE